MINVKNKADCVGCKACGQICPKKCVNFIADNQGFAYPKVNLDLCIDCHLCERVCPIIVETSDSTPVSVKIAQNGDEEILLKSSSGGIFAVLATAIIQSGGVVFGAKFDEEWNVIHAYAQDLQELKKLIGSKYVQSDIRHSFIAARNFLQEGRKVLFTGTPCQIKGLKLFLSKNWDKQLVTVDIACHGVPSPSVWRWFLSSKIKDAKINSIGRISSISFRDKRKGWMNYGTSIRVSSNEGIQSKEIFFGTYRDNLYMQIFLNNLDIRPSCFECPAKSGKSLSDLTLADSWGIQFYYKNVDFSKGFSTIIIRTDTGKEFFNSLNINAHDIDYESVIKYNPSLIKNAQKPDNYAYFWELFESRQFDKIINFLKKLRPTIYSRLKHRLVNLLRFR